MTYTLLEDSRSIQSVQLDTAQVEMWSVGSNGVTKIVCYQENGIHGYYPFLAIYKGDIVTERAPALDYRIVYKEAIK